MVDFEKRSGVYEAEAPETEQRLAEDKRTAEERERREERKSVELIGGGAGVEAVGGVAAIVLTIIGLAGVMPVYMVTISTIVIGAALLMQGASVMARFSKVLAETGRGAVGVAEIGGGMSSEFLGGAAGIALGILGLVNIAPTILTAVAAIVFGGVLLLGSGGQARLNRLILEHGGMHETARHVAREAVMAASGTQALVGLSAIVLGILALVDIVPLTLTLVALLCVATAIVFSGAAVSSRMFSQLSR
jgi:hypothetical protein